VRISPKKSQDFLGTPMDSKNLTGSPRKSCDFRGAEIALSTMWSQRYNHMDRFVRDVQEFGFSQVELNSILTPPKLGELLKLGVKVSSVHCPCPVTTSRLGIPAASLQLSSLDEEERGEALRFAQGTIELASRVGAEAVVIHAGKVKLDFGLEDKLHWLYKHRNSEEFEKARQKLIQERDSRAAPYLEAARRSLLQLARFAQGWGVRLGLETRFYFYEIPQLEEMEVLLQELPPDVVGYWHDVGHAEVKARLGLTPHEEWFIRFRDRLIGVHLHDVLGIQDHRAPGTGDVDWDFIARNTPSSAIKVCEIGEWNTWEACAHAVPFLKSHGVI